MTPFIQALLSDAPQNLRASFDAFDGVCLLDLGALKIVYRGALPDLDPERFLESQGHEVTEDHDWPSALRVLGCQVIECEIPNV